MNWKQTKQEQNKTKQEQNKTKKEPKRLSTHITTLFILLLKGVHERQNVQTSLSIVQLENHGFQYLFVIKKQTLGYYVYLKKVSNPFNL